MPSKPQISGSEDPVMEGETVTLTCTSTGSKPPAKIQWYKGDEELTGEGCGQCVNVFFCCLGVCAQLSVGHWIYCSWHCAELRLCRNACWAWRLFCGKGRLLVVTRWLLWLQFDICTFVCISLLVCVDRAVFVSYSCHIACCLFMRPNLRLHMYTSWCDSRLLVCVCVWRHTGSVRLPFPLILPFHPDPVNVCICMYPGTCKRVCFHYVFLRVLIRSLFVRRCHCLGAATYLQLGVTQRKANDSVGRI